VRIGPIFATYEEYRDNRAANLPESGMLGQKTLQIWGLFPILALGLCFIAGCSGSHGPAGLRGEPGPPGTDGPQGVQSPQGLHGVQGIQGVHGPQGNLEMQGSECILAWRRFYGVPNNHCVADKGSQQVIRGEKGDKGDPGAPGNSLTVAVVYVGIVGWVAQMLLSYAGRRWNLIKTLKIDLRFRIADTINTYFRLKTLINEFKNNPANVILADKEKFLRPVAEEHLVYKNLQLQLVECLWGHEVEKCSLRLSTAGTNRKAHRSDPQPVRPMGGKISRLRYSTWLAGQLSADRSNSLARIRTTSHRKRIRSIPRPSEGTSRIHMGKDPEEGREMLRRE
jgi:Collagen triple helix repeat (20 copies)